MRTPDPKPAVYMALAHALARLSKDDSTQVGAVIVGAGGVVLGSGYNGPPPPVDDARVPWGERSPGVPNKYDLILHGDENAILDALRKGHGRDLVGATMYVTGHPCPGCLLRIVWAGLGAVVYDPGVKPRCVDAVAREKCGAILAALKPGRSLTVTPLAGEASALPLSSSQCKEDA